MIARIRSLGLLMAISLLVVATGPVASSQQAGCDTVTPLMKNWDRITPPRFTLDPRPDLNYTRASDLAVDPIDPSHLFVSNANEVMESTDGACTWKSVYLDEAAMAVQIEIPASGPAGSIILVVQHPEGAIIETSADWGKTWTTSLDSRQKLLGYLVCGFYLGNHNPLVGSGGSRGPLVLAPSDPKTMYLCLEPMANRLNDLLYFVFASGDGGTTWEQRSELGATIQEFAGQYGGPISSGVVQLYVDPIDPGSLWALSNMKSRGAAGYYSSLRASADGARTWYEVKRVGDNDNTVSDYQDLVVQHEPGRPPSLTLLAYHAGARDCKDFADAACFLHSPDNGASWSVSPALSGHSLVRMQLGRSPNRALISTKMADGHFVYRYDLKRRTWTDLTPPDHVTRNENVYSIVASTAGKKSAFFLFSNMAIDRYTGKV